MNFQNLIDQGLLRQEKIGFDQIEKLLKRACKDLESAKLLLSTDESGAYRFAYDAMLHTGRALIFSYGFRPSSEKAHKITIECCKIILGEKYKELIAQFDRLRRKRHYLIYGVGLTISFIEANKALKSAEEFVKEIGSFIEKKNPQKKLI